MSDKILARVALGLLAALALPPLLLQGCSNLACGDGTEQFYDTKTGKTTCVAPSSDAGVTCAPPAMIVGGVCTASGAQFCGTGTKLDQDAGVCVSTNMMMMGGNPTPPDCPTPKSGTFCINGVVRFLKDDSFTKGTTLEVRAYDPLGFLSNPSGTPPQKTVQTDANGTFVMPDLVDQSGMGLIALAVTDVGGPKTYILSGSALNMIAAGGKYRLDLFAVEAAMVAGWDTQAGVGAGKFETDGVYVARFRDGTPTSDESTTHPIGGVVATNNGAPATPQFFFKGDFATIDKTLAATDDKTGGALISPASLTNYSGTGGSAGGDGGAPITWPMVLGASTGGVVFVQNFHPM